jgi:hypothetical protein
MTEKVQAIDQMEASVQRRGGFEEVAEAHGFFEAVCRDQYGNEKWRDVIENLVTTAGKNDLLNKYMAGSSYTQTVRMGLKGTGSAAVGDTQSSHAGWSEVGLANAPAYSGNRPSVTMGAASAGSSGPLYVPEAAPVTFLWEHLIGGFLRRRRFIGFMRGRMWSRTWRRIRFSHRSVTNGVSTIQASITFSAALKGATNNLSVTAVEPNLSPPLESLPTTNLLPAQVLGKPLPPQAPRKL